MGRPSDPWPVRDDPASDLTSVPAEPGGAPRLLIESGRFVLLQCGEIYVTSWDTWGECEVAFPIGGDDPKYADEYTLLDQQTGRTWDRHSSYDWESAKT